MECDNIAVTEIITRKLSQIYKYVIHVVSSS